MPLLPAAERSRAGTCSSIAVSSWVTTTVRSLPPRQPDGMRTPIRCRTRKKPLPSGDPVPWSTRHRRSTNADSQIGRDQRFVAVFQNTFELAGRGPLHRGVDCLLDRILFQHGSEVHERNVGDRYANRDAVESARKVRQHKPNRLSRSGRRGDHGKRRSAGATRVRSGFAASARSIA